MSKKLRQNTDSDSFVRPKSLVWYCVYAGLLYILFHVVSTPVERLIMFLSTCYAASAVATILIKGLIKCRKML